MKPSTCFKGDDQEKLKIHMGLEKPLERNPRSQALGWLGGQPSPQKS